MAAASNQVGVLRLVKDYYAAFCCESDSVTFISDYPNQNLETVAALASSFATSKGFPCNTDPCSLQRPWIALAKDNAGYYYPVKITSDNDVEPITIFDGHRITSKVEAIDWVRIIATGMDYLPVPSIEVPVERIVFASKSIHKKVQISAV